jgi:hypothetical protein
MVAAQCLADRAFFDIEVDTGQQLLHFFASPGTAASQ